MKNKNVQEWLNEKYPVGEACQRDSDQTNKGRKREEINSLDIQQAKVDNGKKLLFGKLKLGEFTDWFK